MLSVRTTSVCVMDAAGKLIRESKVESEPEAIADLLHAIGGPYKRVGLEAGPLSQWLYSGLASAGFPVICVETRHMKAALSAQINKTDHNDARGIAQMMRVGLYKPVHVKTVRSQEIRMLLTARKFVQNKILDAENNLRGLLHNFGLKVDAGTRPQFERRIVELLEQSPHLRRIIDRFSKSGACCANSSSTYTRRWSDWPKATRPHGEFRRSSSSIDLFSQKRKGCSLFCLQSDFHFAGILRVIALDGSAIELMGVEAVLIFSDTRNASVSAVGF
jgi:hypothetical protein